MRRIEWSVLVLGALLNLAGCDQPATSTTQPAPAAVATTVVGVPPQPSLAASQQAALAPDGPNRLNMLAIGNPPAGFAITAVLQGQYRLGDTLQFRVTSERSGYLHIVQVDSQDQVTVLLPNAAVLDNRIEAGRQLVFPAPGSPLKVQAQEPVGESLLAFVVTSQALATNQLLPELFRPDGSSNSGRGLQLIDSGTAALGQASWSIAKYTIDVQATP